MYAAGSPVAMPAITCHAKPTATARGRAHDVHDLDRGSGSVRRRTHRTTPYPASISANASTPGRVNPMSDINRYSQANRRRTTARRARNSHSRNRLSA
jgi:hypothetical protein